METVFLSNKDTPKTKQCVFCAETIQSAAVKCRFCGEFLNTPKARALEAGSQEAGSQEAEMSELDESFPFEARPSLFGLAGTFVKSLFFLAISVLLIRCPVEHLKILALSDNQALTFAQYRVIAGVGLAMLVVFIFVYKALRLKMTCYEITPDRIEWGRGILDRKVDNLDMFRVIDLKMRRTVLDCIFGIGTVELITTDKTDPQFVFEKLRKPRKVYDIIKKASLEADKRNRVVHVE
jgi:membrane protein YdbS with pleckstrin-like domain